jgi:transposase
MLEVLIGGERDPRRPAELARGRMKAKRSELITALDARFDDHHAELARMLLAQIDTLTAQVIIAEVGLDMSRFPPEHLVSWARLCPRTIQSGPATRGGKTTSQGRMRRRSATLGQYYLSSPWW